MAILRRKRGRQLIVHVFYIKNFPCCVKK